MSSWTSLITTCEARRAFDVEIDTIIHNGQPVRMGSEFGVLTVLHGALQSAIADVDDAHAVDAAYFAAIKRSADL